MPAPSPYVTQHQRPGFRPRTPGLPSYSPPGAINRQPQSYGLSQDEIENLDPQRQESYLSLLSRVHQAEAANARAAGLGPAPIPAAGLSAAGGMEARLAAARAAVAQNPNVTYGGAWGAPSPAEGAMSRVARMKRGWITPEIPPAHTLAVGPVGGGGTASYERPAPAPVNMGMQNLLARNIAARNGMYAIPMNDGSVRVVPQGGPATIAGQTLYGNPALEGRDTGVNMIGNPTLRYKQDGAALAALQEAAAARRGETMGARQALVMKAAQARAQERDQRIAQRKTPPDAMAMMAQRNPQYALALQKLALDAAGLQQQGELARAGMAQEGNLGYAQLFQKMIEAQAGQQGRSQENALAAFAGLVGNGVEPGEAWSTIQGILSGKGPGGAQQQGGGVPKWVKDAVASGKAPEFIKQGRLAGESDESIKSYMDKFFDDHGYSVTDGRLKKKMWSWSDWFPSDKSSQQATPGGAYQGMGGMLPR